MNWYRRDGDDLLLSVHVQTRSSRDGIAGLHGDRLKLRITAPAVEGRANARLLHYLSKLFGVPRTRVRLESGEGSRSKRIRVVGVDELPPALTALVINGSRDDGQGS